MPFEEPIKQDVQMSLGYGEQKNPVTGETFFHHGIDFSVNHYLLSAVATGTKSYLFVISYTPFLRLFVSTLVRITLTTS
jgi:hypothetical protein